MVRLYRGTYRKESIDLYLEETLSDLQNLWTLLRSPKQCRFVPVMLAEALSIHVTGVLLAELARLGLPVLELVVNRLLSKQPGCSLCAESASRQALAVEDLTQKFSRFAIWGLPLFLDEVRGAACLLSVWERVLPLAQANWPEQASAPNDELTEVAKWYSSGGSAPDLPTSPMKLLLFAGKGGVGKTTLACASALRMAQERSGMKILLFSIDPAHSLAACLGCEIGALETRVAPGLSAIEFNAQAEYELLKQDYANEVAAVFERAPGQSGIDLAFDHEVMERMLDVAPPGLDEMLALTRFVDLMADNRYDFFVLDTAPTGHLIRFLEMPELIEKWLKTFFSLFLKYQKLFWLPKTSQRMVELSKNIKAFRRMLADPMRAALMAVTIPTEMAHAETADLISACERLGVAVPILFVNMVTPASSCATCSALHRAQAPVLQRFQTMCADRHLALVFRQEEPRGFESLRELGRTLYTTSGQTTRHTNQGEMLCQI
jgi:arsenite-transporting ATPase